MTLSGAAPLANLLTGKIDEVFTRSDGAGIRGFLSAALRSTLSETDANGAQQTQYTYTPFGSTEVSGAVSTNTFQYTGRENDNTGLYYYRARYYSPLLQRFISQDPIGFRSGDTNLYAYVKNNPTNSSDPLGLQEQEPQNGQGRPVAPPELDQNEIVLGETVNHGVEIAGEFSPTGLGQVGGSALGIAGGMGGIAPGLGYIVLKKNQDLQEQQDICCQFKMGCCERDNASPNPGDGTGPCPNDGTSPNPNDVDRPSPMSPRRASH